MKSLIVIIVAIVVLIILKNLLFGKKEKSISCSECGDTYRGIPDGFKVCGSCLERMRDQANKSTAKKITKVLSQRGARFRKSEGL